MKSIYNTIQEWHSLFKAGVISEEEFQQKKNELLGKQSISIDPIEIQQVSEIGGREEEIERLNREYEIIHNDKTWIQKHTAELIGVLVGALLIILIVYVRSKADTSSLPVDTKVTEKLIPGYYYTKYVVSNIYLYQRPDTNSNKITALNSGIKLHVRDTSNNFGLISWTNPKGKQMKYWIKMEDLDSNGIAKVDP